MRRAVGAFLSASGTYLILEISDVYSSQLRTFLFYANCTHRPYSGTDKPQGQTKQTVPVLQPDYSFPSTSARLTMGKSPFSIRFTVPFGTVRSKSSLSNFKQTTTWKRHNQQSNPSLQSPINKTNFLKSYRCFVIAPTPKKLSFSARLPKRDCRL